ncbi:DNA-directed DNA polymerase eta rad30, partial [Friedmanniomyces endolithicus]
RAFGLTRHVTIAEAKEKCPEIICQHVATWKEGEAKWTYDLESADAAREIATRKVSLDPYRIQSRRILAVIKDCLPADKQRVEKASIDEVFLDLSAQVHSLLLERYPDELGGPPPYDDPSEPLPRPPTTALDWAADALVDLNATTEHSEEDDPDWDDITTLLASEIVRDVRARIFTDLHYTCSAGLARNKMVAKLGSAHKKPNGQT